ncbi:YlmC/YmxH family sporulation protein [Bacillaceae bacterium SIJ1]|nr:YlmC/YmxH family sporulation protein [Litoribacterium kuwaitense]
MRFSELGRKEMIDVTNGQRLGMIGDADIELDEQTGEIVNVYLPQYRMWGLKKSESIHTLRWDQIQRIGKDMIIIEIEHKSG